MPAVLWVVELLLVISLVLAFGRLAVGPTLPDRVVALDLIALLTIAVMVVLAIEQGEPVYLKVAAALALVSFLGTVALAQYLERRGRDE